MVTGGEVFEYVLRRTDRICSQTGCQNEAKSKDGDSRAAGPNHREDGAAIS